MDTLYFGTGKPHGSVSAEDWAGFLKDEVTPRFPDGLTQWKADGQWKNELGVIVKEGTYVLQLLHDNSAEADKKLRELIAAYKIKFEQKSVLKVRSGVQAEF